MVVVRNDIFGSMNTKKLILVVEDEEILLDAMAKKFERMDTVQAKLYTDGQEALAFLNKTKILPDAIWLDYYLQGMNGVEFMNILKANPRLKNIPVVVVSNSASKDKVSAMMSLGAKKYIIKADYRLDQIINLVMGTFRKR